MIIQTMPYPAAGGGGAPVFVNAGAGATGSGSITPFWPTHQIGDIGIMLVKTANEAPPSTPLNCTPIYTPTGLGTAAAAGSVRLYAYWIRATSASMAQITFLDAGNGQTGQILVFRGCVATGSPIEATTTDTATASTSVTIPGTTTLGSARLVVAACGIGAPDANTTTNASGWANSDLPDFAEITDFAGIGGAGGGFVVAAGTKASAGSVGASTATLAVAAAQERLCFALIPA